MESRLPFDVYGFDPTNEGSVSVSLWLECAEEYSSADVVYFHRLAEEFNIDVSRTSWHWSCSIQQLFDAFINRSGSYSRSETVIESED